MEIEEAQQTSEVDLESTAFRELISSEASEPLDVTVVVPVQLSLIHI